MCAVHRHERAATLVVVVDDGTELVVGHMADRPDLGCVNALARLQLAAGRCGWSLVVRDPHPTLGGLLELCGLGGVVVLEPLGQPELGEQLRVDEVVQPGDLAP
ncbi:hypothetical protein DSM104299_02996 [Baekduia alba]|nr:hypothetical protein DSM104299_02996 [Baekduia alba]